MAGYKKRMVKEYNQLNKRIKKLDKILVKLEAGTLTFDADTPVYVLQSQLDIMKHYRHMLLVRAEYEGIDLEY